MIGVPWRPHQPILRVLAIGQQHVPELMRHRDRQHLVEARGKDLRRALDALRDELESLLDYESDAARFLETPAAVMASRLPAPSDKAEMIGRQLGPYSIVAPLGSGGMGDVYRARDTKLGRDVAIKILPSHFT